MIKDLKKELRNEYKKVVLIISFLIMIINSEILYKNTLYLLTVS